MEEDKVRYQLERLWSETFGDSEEYISNFFGTYYNSDNILYHCDGDKIVSVLYAIPYGFVSKDKIKLRGKYLCGLATDRKYRGKGIMSDMMQKVEKQAKTDGYDFLFLIPANDGLRRYYFDRGYVDSFYRIDNNYVSEHTFFKIDKELKNSVNDGEVEIIDSVDNLDNNIVLEMLNNGLLMEIKNDINNAYASKNTHTIIPTKTIDYVIEHSYEDWKAVLFEWYISKGKIAVFKRNNLIESIIFYRIINDKIVIEISFSKSDDIEKRMLQSLSEIYPECSICVKRRYDDGQMILQSNAAIWEPFVPSLGLGHGEYEDIDKHETSVDPGVLSYSYGMIKLLDPEGFFKKMGLPYPKGSSGKEAAEIIFRKPAMTDYSQCAFDLPALSLSMFLLME